MQNEAFAPKEITRNMITSVEKWIKSANSILRLLYQKVCLYHFSYLAVKGVFIKIHYHDQFQLSRL